MRQQNFQLIPIFLMLFLASCIGEDFIEVDSNQTSRLKIQNRISGNNDLLNVGDSLVYIAQYFNTMGDEEKVELAWTSSKPEYASINEAGLVKGLKEGVTIIEVTAKGLSDSRVLTVTKLERVELSSDIRSLLVGDSTEINAEYFDNKGLFQAATFSWSSNNVSLASIDQNGMLKALKKGQVDITAMANGLESKPLVITIVDDTVSAASIEIKADTNQLPPDSALQLTAIVRNVNGKEITNEIVQWSSSDASTLAIDNAGLARAQKVGVADITATSSNVVSDPFRIIVAEAVTTSRSATFQDENGYTVSGNVVMKETSTGSLELEFTNFSSQSGPRLSIYLGNNVNGGIEIESLNGRSGSFTVALPNNIGISDYNYVLIWCKAVNLAFGSAKLD